MAQGRRGAAPSSEAYRNRVAQQQAVLNQLRAGKPVVGAQPATPFIGLFGNTGGVQAQIPPLSAARLGGEEVLMSRGGWGSGASNLGSINVGGQTWYPAQSGQDLIYKRAPGAEAGQYGSLFSGGASSPAPASPVPGGGRTSPAPQAAAAPVSRLSPQERAYNEERSRIAQLTEQNPEFQNIGQLRDNLRDQGMAIWAQKNPGLAAKVKPGQSGYDVIQGSLAGQAAAQGYGYELPEQIVMTPPPGVNVPQGLPNVSSFNPIGTYGAQGIEVDPEMAKKFQALLNQTKS